MPARGAFACPSSAAPLQTTSIPHTHTRDVGFEIKIRSNSNERTAINGAGFRDRTPAPPATAGVGEDANQEPVLS